LAALVLVAGLVRELSHQRLRAPRGDKRTPAQQQVAPFEAFIIWRTALEVLSYFVITHDVPSFCFFLVTRRKSKWLIDVSIGSTWRMAGQKR
jgi:hypothetical protein